jgi:hypothetical protein
LPGSDHRPVLVRLDCSDDIGAGKTDKARNAGTTFPEIGKIEVAAAAGTTAAKIMVQRKKIWPAGLVLLVS